MKANVLYKTIMISVKLQITNVLKKRWFVRLIGVGILICLLFQVRWPEFLVLIRQVNLNWILLSLVLQIIALFITTIRWHLIMISLGIKVPIRLSFIHQLIGSGVAVVTPGQLGEFVKVLYHRRLKIPIPESALSVLADRIFDLIVLIIFGLISIAFLFGLNAAFLQVAIIVFSMLFLASFLFFHNKGLSLRRMFSSFTRLGTLPVNDEIKQYIERVLTGIASMSPNLIINCAFLSFINFSLIVAKIYSLALAVQINISFWYFASTVPLFRLAGLLPISISGIGTRDAAVIFLLSRAGVPVEAALLLSLLSLVTLEIQALVGMLLWWRDPPTLERGFSVLGGSLSKIEKVFSDR